MTIGFYPMCAYVLHTDHILALNKKFYYLKRKHNLSSLKFKNRVFFSKYNCSKYKNCQGCPLYDGEDTEGFPICKIQ